MDDSWHTYPSIRALGHRAVVELFADPVLVEEKIDGSQFSFGVIDGELRARSKGADLVIDAAEKMFSRAIDTIRELESSLHPGWTYRAEYLQKPKHNALSYDRVPAKHLIIFDINDGHESYLPYDRKRDEAARLGLESVPLLLEGQVKDAARLRELLEQPSILGGQKIEGVVVKNYAKFGPDGKVLMGKFVSEAYKEIHGKAWKLSNPSNSDIIQLLIDKLRTPARWSKAIQHLREAGQLDNSPRDIGKLMLEVPNDVWKECKADITDALIKYAWPKIRRGLTAGLPEYYKQHLLEVQFDGVTPSRNANEISSEERN